MNKNKLNEMIHDNLKKILFEEKGILLTIKTLYETCTKEIDDLSPTCSREDCPLLTWYSWKEENGKEIIKRCCILSGGARRAINIRGLDLKLNEDIEKLKEQNKKSREE